MLYPFSSNNCVQDAVIMSVITGLTSIYAATVTYTIIGFRATEKYEDCISMWVETKYLFLKKHRFEQVYL